MRGAGRGIRRLFQLGLWGPRVDEGVDWEIEHHVQERADELESGGLSRAEAEREALRELGDAGAVKRELRRIDGAAERMRSVKVGLEALWRDVVYGARGARRNPSFSATLVVTLGLGIGATVAVFAIVDALLLRPLPYAASDELVEVLVGKPGSEYGRPYVPFGLIREGTAYDEVFAGVLPHGIRTLLYTGGTAPRNLTATLVGASFEEVLGVHPILGRGLVQADEVPGAHPVALMSYGFWRSEFGGDPGVVGRTVRLSGTEYTVIGVMPAGFKFPQYSSREFWMPIPQDVPSTYLLARVRPGRMSAAESRTNALAAGRMEQFPGLDSAALKLRPLEEHRGGNDDVRRGVWLLAGAVALILLVALVNGSNLLLVRGAVRRREIVVRAALGASRGRILRQLFTETMGLAVLSAVVATVVALLAVRGIQALLPSSLVFWLPHALGIEWRALVFAAGIALVCGVLLGVLPALRSVHAARLAGADGLGTRGTGGSPRSRLRRSLAVGQVALSVVLLTGAALLLNSFIRLTRVDVGVETEGVGLVQITLSAQAQPDSAARSSFLPRLAERIRALPGVAETTATGSLPGNMLFLGTALQAEGEPPVGRDPMIVPATWASPGFFDVLRPRVLAGRPFESADAGRDVAIIDEHLAGYLWPDGPAVGNRFRVREEEAWLTVVGVVADLQLERRDDREGDFEILFPFDPTTAGGYVTLAYRTRGDPATLFPAVRRAVAELAPDQPIRDMLRADDAYAETLDLPRFLAVLVTGLAAFALVLAAIGLFGVLAYEVTQRAAEMGVRMAIGAEAGQLRSMVVREGLVLAGAGAVIGLIASLGLARVLRAQLFEIEPTDPATLVAVLAAMIATAAIASYIPARRATRVDPAEVLRAE